MERTKAQEHAYIEIKTPGDLARLHKEGWEGQVEVVKDKIYLRAHRAVKA